MNQIIPEKLLKPYDPGLVEDAIYKRWMESGFFDPDVCIEKEIIDKNAESFSIVLPPPNVTGILHLGHAYEDALQDTIVRFARMRGKRTLWVPGTDSAAIATQARVEKDIQKEENKSRYDLGREELVRRVSKFAKDSENTIIGQVKKMGASLDWSRYAYTLDDSRNLAVTTAFKRMYDTGLIYRGHRIVNWDPKGQTTISDDEIVYKENKTKLYTFKYWKDFPISIATTRPETKLGDTGIAVHPDDVRYSKYIGEEFEGNFAGTKLKIKIVSDISIDPEFGTGAVGLTPAHSMIDYEIGEKNNLPIIQVINEYAKMSVDNPEFKDKKTTEARSLIVEWLKKEKLLEKEEEITQNISTADRTGGIIEPLPKLQWFIAVNKEFDHFGKKTTLKEIMYLAVESGDVNMPQEHFKKSYFHWIKNLHDWCISRQIWFGHRIPVWYKEKEIYCDTIPPKETGWEQDSDVLDTWFSSALWTFSTLGWPKETSDLKTFHPTSFMSPAYEIMFLWISRMILMSCFHLNQVPFKTVMLHGIVRDSKGRKFSKSLGNGIDPIDIIAKYGADALRIGLLVGTVTGNDIKFDEQKIKGYKNFANKLWNITRFILTIIEDVEYDDNFNKYDDEDKKLMKIQKDLLAEITKEMEEYKLYLVGEKLYHYVWHSFADIIIEDSKKIFAGTDNKAILSRKQFLLHSLDFILKTLHPFIPFITEEIWGILPQNKGKNLLMIQKWPI